MARYIDAEEAYALMEERGWYENGDRDIAEGVLDQMPTCDVAPVVHAQWWLERDMDGKPYCFHCTNCDADGHHTGNKVAYSYCPECGAKMDREKECITFSEEGPAGKKGAPGICPRCGGTRIAWDSSDDTSHCLSCGWTNRAKRPFPACGIDGEEV